MNRADNAKQIMTQLIYLGTHISAGNLGESVEYSGRNSFDRSHNLVYQTHFIIDSSQKNAGIQTDVLQCPWLG